ncbi:MAG: hypothetical protein ACRES9_07380 [Gammaproteobacteria bacterium]
MKKPWRTVMSRLHFILPAVAVAVLALTAFAPNAIAQTQAGTEGGNASPPSTRAMRQVAKNLPPMTVEGRSVPLPIALQVIKKGLKLPWTNNLNGYRIRCRITSQPGSHFPGLFCESNRQHIIRVRRLHLALETDSSGTAIPAINFMFRREISVGPLLTLLHKIPSTHASYTLRVTDHGKAAVDYVVKNGELVSIRRYVYKKGKKPARH